MDVSKLQTAILANIAKTLKPMMETISKGVVQEITKFNQNQVPDFHIAKPARLALKYRTANMLIRTLLRKFDFLTLFGGAVRDRVLTLSRNVAIPTKREITHPSNSLEVLAKCENDGYYDPKICIVPHDLDFYVQTESDFLKVEEFLHASYGSVGKEHKHYLGNLKVKTFHVDLCRVQLTNKLTVAIDLVLIPDSYIPQLDFNVNGLTMKFKNGKFEYDTLPPGKSVRRITKKIAKKKAFVIFPMDQKSNDEEEKSARCDNFINRVFKMMEKGWKMESTYFKVWKLSRDVNGLILYRWKNGSETSDITENSLIGKLKHFYNIANLDLSQIWKK